MYIGRNNTFACMMVSISVDSVTLTSLKVLLRSLSFSLALRQSSSTVHISCKDSTLNQQIDLQGHVATAMFFSYRSNCKVGEVIAVAANNSILNAADICCTSL